MKKTFKLLLFLIIFSFTTVVNATTYYVTGEGARVRSSAKNSDNVIGRLSYGQKIDVISLENGWYKIKFKDGYGYVTHRFVSAVEETSTSNTIGLTKTKTNLKKKNLGSSKTITTIPKKAIVKVISQDAKWTLVQYNEKQGYVKTKSLSFASKPNEEVVGTYNIKYTVKNKSRKKNINKSVQRLDNVVIKDGEKFSFLKTVGTDGYLNAPEFKKKSKVYGGGVSEVATSLYLSIRDAQRNNCFINVTEQNRHSSKTPYAMLGEEAMIDLKNNKDLEFVNKSGKTIKIYSYVNGYIVSFVITTSL